MFLLHSFTHDTSIHIRGLSLSSGLRHVETKVQVDVVYMDHNQMTYHKDLAQLQRSRSRVQHEQNRSHSMLRIESGPCVDALLPFWKSVRQMDLLVWQVRSQNLLVLCLAARLACRLSAGCCLRMCCSLQRKVPCVAVHNLCHVNPRESFVIDVLSIDTLHHVDMQCGVAVTCVVFLMVVWPASLVASDLNFLYIIKLNCILFSSLKS